MPLRVARRTAGAAKAGADPIARIQGIAVAAIAVIRPDRVGDEVPTGQESPCEIGVTEQHARIENGHDDPGRADGDVPGRWEVDPAEGIEVVPLERIEGVVGLPLWIRKLDG